MNRREFISGTALGISVLSTGVTNTLFAGPAKSRKMTMNLVCGAIGVSANQVEAIELASRHGFESVEADANYLTGLSDDELTRLMASMKEKNLSFGASGLSVEFRQDELRFKDGMEKLPRLAAGLKRAGVDRMGTWLMPCDGKLTYLQNFRQHATRLKEVAVVLKDSGVRLGLEYVGPKTSWTSRRFSFIHTMPEMRELIAEIGTGNVGLVLDSWHWWHASDSAADILALEAKDVVAVDLNDAPAGIPKDQQSDGKREIPCATGVINLGPFLSALNQIGYDGPVRVEPFNEAVRKMSKDDACEAAIGSLKKAFELIA